jgi:hypothetical protein
VVEDAPGSRIRVDEIGRAIKDGLTRTGVFVLSRDYYETPRSHMREEIFVSRRPREAAVSPGENRVLKTIGAQMFGVVEDELFTG